MCLFWLHKLGCYGNIFKFLAFPLELLLSDATEDALQKACAPHCTVRGLHSKGRIHRAFDIFIAGSV